MLSVIVWCCVVVGRGVCGGEGGGGEREGEGDVIEILDLTQPATVQALIDYYGAVEKRWKMCINCGVPGLGTTMRLEHEGSSSQAVHPALIPSEYLLTRLVVIDVSALVALQPALVVSLEVALQWPALRRDPAEPTLLLFRFGAGPHHHASPHQARACVCKVPGISFALAEWVVGNLSRVVGVGTDAPTLESEETREFSTRSVAAILARAGLYMLEGVYMRPNLPESGCMAVAMPLKLQHANYVPARLTAFCPAGGGGGAGGAGGGGRVVLGVRRAPAELDAVKLYPAGRAHDVVWEDIINH